MYVEGGEAPHRLPEARQLKLFAAYSDDAGVWTTSDRFR